MPKVNARRDRRFEVRIPVAILSARGEVKGTTENASYRGVLIRTEQAPPPRQLVRLRVTVPTQTSDLRMHGMVVHRADVGAGLSEIGVSFYGLDGEPRSGWERFVQSIQAGDRPASVERADAPAPPTDRGEELVVAVASVDALERLVSRDVARGRLRVQPGATLRVGAPVRIRLIHPETQESFTLAGLVRRCLDGGALAIELAAMDGARQALLAEFTSGKADYAVVDLASLRAPPAALGAGATR